MECWGTRKSNLGCNGTRLSRGECFMTAIINYHVASDQSGVIAELASHTCSTDGFVYAWVDPVYPLLVWEYGSCPADAVITSLQTVITAFVTAHFNSTDTITDNRQRVLTIISKSRDDAVTWLNLHTTSDIAGYISGQTAQLQGYILDALTTQGIVDPV